MALSDGAMSKLQGRPSGLWALPYETGFGMTRQSIQSTQSIPQNQWVARANTVTRDSPNRGSTGSIEEVPEVSRKNQENRGSNTGSIAEIPQKYPTQLKGLLLTKKEAEENAQWVASMETKMKAELECNCDCDLYECDLVAFEKGEIFYGK